MRNFAFILSLICLICHDDFNAETVSAQTLEKQLITEDFTALAKAAREKGDARRGAIVFYQPHLACRKCHSLNKRQSLLGPNLTKHEKNATDAYLVESLLKPSKVIKKGFEPMTVVTTKGTTVNGLLVTNDAEKIQLREFSQNGKLINFLKSEVDEVLTGKVSIMPAGQINQLASRQQFLDLIRYLMDIRDGGLAKVRELEPPPASYAARPLPEYEKIIDHAGMIADLDDESFKRGEAIYNRLCINCHGNHDRPGSLPTSLRFATGKFKNGNDPFTMYQTLTRGFGMMVPQMWMVPQQKYDVIHYIRQAYLKSHNPTQFASIEKKYLDQLPKGTTRGPEPSNILPWEQMDYGPNLVATYEIGNNGSNFAYKGNAIRLDQGPGGVSQGRHWMIFDYDTLRVAAAWSGEGFIDYNGINFNGRHGIHPRVVGAVQYENTTGPGWANPKTGSFDDPRLVGRDNRLYGPLPRSWAHYKGMYYHGQQCIISYTVGKTKVLEMAGLVDDGQTPIQVGANQAASVKTERSEKSNSTNDSKTLQATFTRTFNIGPRAKPMILQVARLADGENHFRELKIGSRKIAILGPKNADETAPAAALKKFAFNGSTSINVTNSDDFDLTKKDYTVFARIKTKKGGTILCKTANTPKWIRDGKSLFIRGGKLVFDIGWVGAVQSQNKVNDGRWHDIAMTFNAKTGRVKLFVDGELDGQGELKPKQKVKKHIVRIAYTSSNFPGPQSFFKGEISEVRFYQQALSEDQIADVPSEPESKISIVAHWRFDQQKGERIEDISGNEHHGIVAAGKPGQVSPSDGSIVAGVAGELSDAQWSSDNSGNLRLKIPAGEKPLRFTLWTVRVENPKRIEEFASSIVISDADRDLTVFTQGGRPRWPETLKTKPLLGKADGPFAVDVLTQPANNPWFCRMRLTGFDFFPDGDSVVVSAWDGNVWLVSGLSTLSQEIADDKPTKPPELVWKRIASGLFQPLGVKIVENKIYVTCRDQICILHDLNDDQEIDYYENFNNDHQVTDHFHEFAMGLQTDDSGNFYYAKSARHALTALVPHHGTLLRVSRDGAKTEIVANGFRAANGVCINPDGTFIVTDQEGHWNPKNRINWVTEGGFYGNMFGYHDVTDSSDSAMQQPLCWITNAFDRSPAELLWVDSPKWGPLNGSLLNFSYGYGKIYVVPHEKIDGQMQGGMCALPISRFPTGIMRGRFHPVDGQLYSCGMFAWAGNQQQPGGFYRVRYTGQPVHLPIGLQATRDGVDMTFSGTFDPDSVRDVDNYSIKIWSLKRTAGYGSKHYNEKELKVAAASLSQNGQTISLQIPEISPTWCMEIRYSVESSDGTIIEGVIHNTIHHLGTRK